jgi:predicted acetyltransferase
MNGDRPFDRPRAPVELVLRLPRDDEEAEFYRAYRLASEDVPNFLLSYEDGMSFRRYIDLLAAQAQGRDLPPGFVPSTFLFAFVGDRIVGRVSIRHRLNDFLERIGGHIGYAVVPEFRRQGYATAILHMSVEIARRDLGIDRILVTCDNDNAGSIRTIEKNGGVLEDVVSGPDLEMPKRRYWIEPA